MKISKMKHIKLSLIDWLSLYMCIAESRQHTLPGELCTPLLPPTTTNVVVGRFGTHDKSKKQLDYVVEIRKKRYTEVQTFSKRSRSGD